MSRRGVLTPFRTARESYRKSLPITSPNPPGIRRQVAFPRKIGLAISLRARADRSPPGKLAATEGAVYVACSTLCFGRHTFENTLRIIAELGFNKFDVALYEKGPHLRPSEVAGDVIAAYNRLRCGSGLTP